MTVPPIPVTCATRPTVGGLVAPYVNIRLADGGVDFRTPHQGRYTRCWTHHLCQTCGNPLGPLSVLFGGPNQLRRRLFDEPPLCTPCAAYASHACPMVAGRQTHYVDRPRLVEGHRGRTCPDPGCECGGFTDSDPSAGTAAGDPAHPWYALYVHTGGWTRAVRDVKVRCTDKGCVHPRELTVGGVLTTIPVRVTLVSAPGQGRVWRRLTAAETVELLSPEKK